MPRAEALRRALPAALVALLAALALPACGGDGSVEAEGDPKAGEALLAEQEVEPSCGACHTLVAAEFTGTTAPDLDRLSPGYQRVHDAVSEGPGAMPSYSDQLSDEELHHVAAYVSGATSR